MYVDFSKSENIFDKMFDKTIPFLIKIFYNDIQPYKYLIQSRVNYISNKQLDQLLTDNDFEIIEKKRLMFGIIDLYISKNIKDKIWKL